MPYERQQLESNLQAINKGELAAKAISNDPTNRNVKLDFKIPRLRI
jgi:hypothetical protein